MSDIRAEAIGLSRYLSWPGAVALGAGLSLAVQLTLVDTLLRTAGPQAYLLTWLCYLPLLLAWLDLPGEHGPFGLTRLAGYPRLAFGVAWIELGGLGALAALLAQGTTLGVAALGGRLWGLDLEPTSLLPMVLGAVAINELIGTRAHSRAASVLLSVAVLLFSMLLLVSGLDVSGLGSGSATHAAPVSTPLLGQHQLAAPALLASLLWGPQLLLSRRRLMRRHSAVLPMAVLWLLLPLVGAVGLWLGLRHPELTASGVSAAAAAGTPALHPRLELSVVGIGVAICLLGLSQALAEGVRLFTAMALSGMAPKALVGRRSERGIPLVPLLVLTVAGWGAAFAGSFETVAAGAALAVLWLSPLVLWPHIRRSGRDRSGRELGLPFHPLIPALVSAGCVFLSLVLPKPALTAALIWVALGGICFLLYGRSGLARSALEEHGVGELSSMEEGGDPRVLVAVGGAPGTGMSTLIQVAACWAARRKTELVVLRVEPLIDQRPWIDARGPAERSLQELRAALADLHLPESLVVHPLVRIAPTVAGGILEAARETRAELLVLGRSRPESRAEPEPVVEKVFAATAAAVAVVHGTLPKKMKRVLVASAGGPHAPVALELAEALAGVSTRSDGEQSECETGSLEAAILNVVTPDPAPAKGDEAIRLTRERRGDGGAVDADGTAGEPAVGEPVFEEVVVRASTVADGIEREAGLQDILLLGATVDRLLGQTRLEGFSTTVAEGRRGVTIVVKRREAAPRFWGRRLWEWVSNPLPTLTDEQRIKVQLSMRNAARAGVDFYVLISLSAAIATLGLMQSSAAVVIGAMLVAPLMSPILGMGHAIVRGHLVLVRRAASSTLKGVGIAVAVGALFPLLFPGISPTAEILARGAPSLLDLAVALASGAAAAYAVSRPEVAAALPGVAIAAALVPPLCVVGFGLGASELTLAGGALLLFTTNLCAIVLSAAVVFLMMGFRPRRAHRGEAVWRALAFAGIGLLMVSIPLGSQTRDLMRTSQARRYVAERLADSASESFRVEALRFDRSGKVLWARVEVRSFVEDPPLEEFAEIRKDLAADLGIDVRFDLAVSRAERVWIGDSSEEAP